MFLQSPKTRQSFKLPAFLLKFWAKQKQIVEITYFKKPGAARVRDFTKDTEMEIGNFGDSNWTNSNGAIRIWIRNQIDYVWSP